MNRCTMRDQDAVRDPRRGSGRALARAVLALMLLQLSIGVQGCSFLEQIGPLLSKLVGGFATQQTGNQQAGQLASQQTNRLVSNVSTANRNSQTNAQRQPTSTATNRPAAATDQGTTTRDVPTSLEAVRPESTTVVQADQ